MCVFATAAADDDAEMTQGRGSGQRTPLGVKQTLRRMGK
jgi:hypothetical protein